MSSGSSHRAFLRVLFPDNRLLVGGVVGTWLLSALVVALWLAPASPLAMAGWTLGSPPAAAQRVDQLLRRADGWTADGRAADALWTAALVSATDLHDPQRALTILDQLLSEHPASPHTTDALAWRAALLARMGAPDTGAAFQAVAEHAPQHPEAGQWWVQAADHYAARGQTLPAIEAYEAATAHAPQAAVAWLALGRLHIGTDPAAAHSAFKEAVAAARRPSTARLARLGAATALERLEGPEAALAEVDEAIAHDGTDPSLERRRDRLRSGG